MTTNKGILVLGATSSIAKAIAHEFAKKGYDLFLASRDATELARMAKDLALRYRVAVYQDTFDVEDLHSHAPFFQRVLTIMPHFEGVITAIGSLGNHSEAIRNFEEADKIFRTNFIGISSMLSLCANELEKRQKGFLITVSALSGERGKKGDYFYGSSKAGLNTYLEGLRNRLASSYVHVLTVKPGYIDTAMTFGTSPSFFLTSPSLVGQQVIQAFEKGKEEVYIPKYWRYVMLLARFLPTKIFQRLDL